MKKVHIFLLFGILTSLLLVGCGGNSDPVNTREAYIKFDGVDGEIIMQGETGEVEIKFLEVRPDVNLDDVELSLKGNTEGIVVRAAAAHKPSNNLKQMSLQVAADAALGTRNLKIIATFGREVAETSFNLTIGNEFKLEMLLDLLIGATSEESVEVAGSFRAQVVGKGELTDENPEVPSFEEDREEGVEEADEEELREIEQGRFYAFNPVTGNEIEVVSEGSLLKSVHDFQVARNLDEGSAEIDDPSTIEGDLARGSLQAQVIMGGFDTRVRKKNTTIYPYRTIAQFDGNGDDDSDCSGTLIGPRLIITSAHCINKRGTNIWYSPKITPGRNGKNISPYGSTQTSPQLSPNKITLYFTPAEWRNSTECKKARRACQRWDWGLIVIPDRLGDQTDWMGYAYIKANSLKKQNIYNRGYPRCLDGNPSTPANCDPSSLYGDQNPCGILKFYYIGLDGWRDLITHNCDTSKGHSGSALYFYTKNNKGKYVPVVTALHGPVRNGVNAARRLGPNETFWISLYRNISDNLK